MRRPDDTGAARKEAIALTISRQYMAHTQANGAVSSISTERGALGELLASLPTSERIVPNYVILLDGRVVRRQDMYVATCSAQIVNTRYPDGRTSRVLYAIRPDGALDTLGYIVWA